MPLGEIWEILLREEKRAVGSELFGSFIAKAIAIFFLKPIGDFEE